jgi:hypothetical protein
MTVVRYYVLRVEMGPTRHFCGDPTLHWKEARPQFGQNAEQALPRLFIPPDCFILELKVI